MASTRKGVNAARLRTIYQRQHEAPWDETYAASIRATPQEAPSISHALTITPGKLQGREVHLLSNPELSAALLALYHPWVVGLQEQRALFPEASPHPLWTFPGADRSVLPSLKGIIDVADRLGYLDALTYINVDKDREEGESVRVVFPWVGDFLLAIQPPDAHEIFAVNWPVKSAYADFKRPFGNSRHGDRAKRRVLARHEIEKVYYEDAAIRTIQVADEAIDDNVVANLRQLFLHHRRPADVSEEQRNELLHKFQTALEVGIPPADVIMDFAERGTFTIHQTRTTFYQAIWNRELRVDLFHPILINLPQRAETHDVIDVYADWFRR